MTPSPELVGVGTVARSATSGAGSIGGFGALDLARIAPKTFCFAARQRLYGVAMRIDVGRDDPFKTADVALARELHAHGESVRLQVHGGGHSG